MNIENIAAFLTVYRYNSFTKAAKALYITQPSLSSRIRKLEQTFGTTLICRDSRQAALTEDGALFLPYALQIVNAYQHACKLLDKGSKSIRIGTHISVSSGLLPQALKYYKTSEPNAVIDIFTGLPEQLLDELLNHRCDFLITQDMDYPDEVEKLPVYQDPVSLIVPAGHPFLSRSHLPGIDEVGLEPMICSTAQPECWAALDELFAAHNVTPNIILRVDSLEVIKSMILNGIGISFLPELSISAELASGELVALSPMMGVNLHRDIVVSYLNRHRPAYLDRFLSIIQKIQQPYEAE